MIDLHVAWEHLNFSPNHTAAQKSADEQFLHRNRSFYLVPPLCFLI